MSVLVNLWTQVRKQLRWANGGTGNTQGWSTGVIKVCTNRTGSTLALGTLVKLSLTYNDARVEPTTAATDPVLGVVVGYWSTDDPNTLILADAPDAHSVAVMTQGTVRVGLNSGGATRGQYAFPSTTSGMASSSASAGSAAFGVFQSSGGSGGTALVVLNETQGAAGAGGGGSYGTPNLTLSTSNSAGVASTGIRTDATILAFDVTTPAAITLGGSGAVGSAGTAARRDHKHAVTGALDDLSDVAASSPSTNDVLSWNGSSWVPVAPGGASFATPSIALGTAAAAGAASTVIRSDATIVAFDATVPTTIAYGDAPNVGAAAVAARRDHRHGAPSGTATAIAAPSDLGIFGNGKDGTVTISADTNLSSDMFYDTLTVNSGKTLNTNGYRVFVKNTLTNAGTICRKPNAGAGGGSSGTGGSALPDSNTIGAPAGASSPAATNNGNNGSNSTNVTASLGGNGGAGGASSGGQTGGTGGSTGYTLTAYPLAYPACVQLVNWSRATLTANAPGASGGSGATTNLGRGGGGGSGGGCTIVVAKKIDNTGGVIHARGGDGGAGNANAGNGGGGGGGGGGGILVVVYNELVAAGTMDAAGGIGGAAGNGSATAGANGSAGTTIILPMT